MKYVSDKDKKALAADLKTIYGAPNEVKAQEQLNPDYREVAGEVTECYEKLAYKLGCY